MELFLEIEDEREKEHFSLEVGVDVVAITFCRLIGYNG